MGIRVDFLGRGRGAICGARCGEARNQWSEGQAKHSPVMRQNRPRKWSRCVKMAAFLPGRCVKMRPNYNEWRACKSLSSGMGKRFCRNSYIVARL